MTRARASILSVGVILAAGGWSGCSGNNEPQPTPPAPAEAAGPEVASPNRALEGAADDGGGAPEPAEATGESGASADGPADPLAPLSEAQATIFRRGEGETLGKAEITYLKTNEIRHDVWFPYIEGRGGAYLGVGSDQNFTLIGVARSELAFFTDIDPRVPRLHALYEALIEAAETPEAHLAMWDPANEAATLELLEVSFAGRDPEERKVLLREYRADRETVWRHLQRVAARSRDGVGTTWLSNPAYYDHVRRLFLADRIRYEAGDLTGTTTVKLAGELLRELDIPLGVLYLSNAEEYFTYGASYRANIRGLPAAPGAIVLRTIYNKERNKDYEMADALWNYQVQPLADFQARLEEAQNSTRNRMISFAEKAGEFERHPEVSGLSRLAIGAP